MKTLAAVLLFGVYGFAQPSSAPGALHEACGPLKINFDTSTSNDKPPAQPEPGKARVYVAEDFPYAIGSPTFKIGLDGAWVGATHGISYLVFSVDPGEHHLCARWQSHRRDLSRMVSFAHLSAEPGKVYYFRVRIYEIEHLDLDPIDPDEGQYLVASSPQSVSHPKR